MEQLPGPAGPSGAAPPGAAPVAGTAKAVGLVAGGMAGQQVGSAVATLLFPQVGPTGVAALRLSVSAVLLLVLFRPRLRGHGRSDWAVVAGFGTALGAMNLLFYEAIARIPLGPAVTIEVLGPLAVAVFGSRGAVRWLWAGLALAGVALLGGGGYGELTAAGTAFALGAAAMWAAYILLSARAGARFPRVDGLAMAMTVGAVLSLPLGIATAGADLLRPAVLGWGAVVALLSSALPYSLELLALRRLPAATFAVLMSLAPAVAALAGWLLLGQMLGPGGWAAVALVVAASAGAVWTSGRQPQRGHRGGGQGGDALD
ncbi:EamA family transporter [Pilimelia columellifera]|uniref:EamA family transporter n=1 Tax=Pilimelia columellifera subsp. columellifera TaxID=706583 RepID=A0ABP6ADG6_9ACTN